MKITRRAIALLLCLVMVLSYVPMVGHAANGGPNVTISLPKTEVEAGETIDVWLGINETKASSIAFGFDFDNTMLEVTGITAKANAKLQYSGTDDFGDPYSADLSATSVSTKEEANASGHVGAVWANDTVVTYSANTQLVRIRFKALKAGTVKFKIFEDSSGTDGYKGEWTFPAAPSTPACEHTNTKAVSNNDGTHNIVCTNAECGEVVTPGVHCTGTDDGDHTTAVICECGNVVTAGTAHVDTNPKDHKCDIEGCNVPQGEHKSNATYPCQDGICEYCNQPVKASEIHNDGDTDHDCDVCGAAMGEHKSNAAYPCQAGICEYCQAEMPATAAHTGGTATCTAPANCSVCRTQYGDKAAHSFNSKASSTEATPADCENAATYYVQCDNCNEVTREKTVSVGEAKGHGKTAGFRYGDITATTHNVYCGDCDKKVEENVIHTYNAEHKCVCGDVEKFILEILDMNTQVLDCNSKIYYVPYGTNIKEFLLTIQDDLVLTDVTVDNDTAKGTYTFVSWVNSATYLPLGDDETVTGDGQIYVDAPFTGWRRIETADPWGYEVGNSPVYGWYKVDGAWYFFFCNEETGWSYRAEGMTRVSYPTVTINGKVYEADKETIAYCEQKGQTFVDATEAWFFFDQDGKFVQTTGIVEFKDATRYLVDGMLAWHPGLVEVDGVYYYFIGDTSVIDEVAIGGNIAANGDTYITRNNDVESSKVGDVYNFVKGQLSGADGIVDGKYYEGSRLMLGNGLTKLGENFIYVRSNGEVVMNAEYYVPENDLGVVAGSYTFDENGYLQNPKMTDKNGIVDGYYYVNGKIAYNKGLIELENGKVIYVRSNGKVAIGVYYVTNLSNYNGTDVKVGDKVTFDASGYMVAAKNGIVDGYYYENGKIIYGAGLIEYNGGYIYVRSNGKVATGVYYVTNLSNYNGTDVKVGDKLTFGNDGMMIVE